MLQYGFFNLVRLDEKEGMYRKVRDTLLVKEMVDSEDSTYDFVSDFDTLTFPGKNQLIIAHKISKDSSI